jgi:integrase
MERWLRAQRWKSKETETIYRCAAKRINTWAADLGVAALGDVTADMLDEWRGMWSPTSERKYNRIGLSSQSAFLGHLKRFFRYAVRVGLLDRNPATELDPIAKSKKRTQVLSPEQFRQVLAAIPRYTAAKRGMIREFGPELRVLFLLQRWSDLRLLDCLMLPRTGLKGNRLRTVTAKTGDEVDGFLPEEAVEALRALSPSRERFKPNYFLWEEGVDVDYLSTKWDNSIRELNKYLDLKDEEGGPMRFHSHQLRDTYAVELLKAGVSLEDVSRLLTHKSIKVTETYYAHWVPDRVTELRRKSVGAMKKMGATFRE